MLLVLLFVVKFSLPFSDLSVWRGVAVVARWIRDRTVPGSNRVIYSGHLSYCGIPVSRDLHRVALGQLSLAIPPWVRENEEQLCAAETTDMFLRFTSPESGNLQH